MVPGSPTVGNVPAWDVSLNYSPVAFRLHAGGVGGEAEAEAVVAGIECVRRHDSGYAGLNYDGVAQALSIVGIDGVPTGSEDGTVKGRRLLRKHFLLAPAARVEFILTPPGADGKEGGAGDAEYRHGTVWR